MKQKTHKGTVKRIKKTKTGKLIKGKVNNSHLFRKQSANKKMRKKRTNNIKDGFVQKINKLLG